MPGFGNDARAPAHRPDLVAMLGGDTLRYLPAALLPAAASLAGIVVFTRIFTAADYGRYALALSTVLVLSVLLAGWIQQSVLRMLPRYEERGEADTFLSTVVTLTAGTCAGTALLLLLVYLFARKALGVYEPLFLPALLLLIAEIALMGLNSVHQARLQSKRFAVFRVSSSVARLALALAYVFLVRRDVMGLLIGAAVAQVIVLVPMAHSLLPARTRLRFDPALVRSFLAYGMPMVAWLFCGQVLDLSDRYVIGLFRGTTEVGIYAANYGLITMGFGLLSGPLIMAAHPLIMTAYERDGVAVRATISTFSRYYWLITLPVVVLLCLFRREIVDLLLGAEFREGHAILPFVLGGVFLWGLSMFAHKSFELMERTVVMVVLVVVCAVANLLLNFAFVPQFGYVAAAAATFACYLLYLVLLLIVDRSPLRWHIPWVAILRSTIAAAAMAAVVVVARRVLPSGLPPLLVVVCGALTGTALYVALLFLTRELRREIRDAR